MTYDDEPLTPDDSASVDDWIEQARRESALQSDTPDDLPDPRLIQQLQEYYMEEAQSVNQRVERVRQRLEQRAGAQLEDQQQAAAPSRTQPLQERRYPMQEPAPFFRPSRPWPRRLSTLVAAVLLVVLVGGLVAGLVLVRHPGNTTGQPLAATATRTPGIVPTPTTPANTTNLLFDSLHMTDATTGWTVAVPPNTTWGDMAAYKVLRTIDGGRHWKDVTPKFNTAQAQLSGAPLHPYSSGALPILQLFLTDSVAWMLDLPTTLFGTVDGGRTWQKVAAPAEVAQYTFINANDGWVLGTDGGVYQTTDGGQNWTKLQSMQQGQPPAGILPQNSLVDGLVFLNANDGWMTGLTDQTDSAWVYLTHDGGQTWQHQALALPSGTIDPPILVEPPTFTSDHDGFMWANLNVHPLLQERAGTPQSGGGGLELYITHDGGATWQDTGQVPGGVGVVSFIDGNHGWVGDYGASQPSLWVTSDGAQHWNQLPTSRNFLSIGQLDFVSATTGWAVSGVNFPQSEMLLKTQDGGHTWAQINYSIS